MTDRRRRHPNGLGQGFAHEKLPPVMQMIMRLTGGRDDEGFEIQGTVQGARRVVSGDDDDLHLLIVGTRRDAEGVPFRIVPRLVEPLFRQLTQQRVALPCPYHNERVRSPGRIIQIPPCHGGGRNRREITEGFGYDVHSLLFKTRVCAIHDAEYGTDRFRHLSHSPHMGTSARHCPLFPPVFILA